MYVAACLCTPMCISTCKTPLHERASCLLFHTAFDCGATQSAVMMKNLISRQFVLHRFQTFSLMQEPKQLGNRGRTPPRVGLKTCSKDNPETTATNCRAFQVAWWAGFLPQTLAQGSPSAWMAGALLSISWLPSVSSQVPLYCIWPQTLDPLPG